MASPWLGLSKVVHGDAISWRCVWVFDVEVILIGRLRQLVFKEYKRLNVRIDWVRSPQTFEPAKKGRRRSAL